MTFSRCRSTKKVKLTKVMLLSTWRTHNKLKNSGSSSTSTNGRMHVQAKCAWSHTHASKATRSCATVSRTRRSSVTNYLNPTFRLAVWWISSKKSCPWPLKPLGGITKQLLTCNVPVICQSQGYSNNATKIIKNRQGLTRCGLKYSTWLKKN